MPKNTWSFCCLFLLIIKTSGFILPKRSFIPGHFRYHMTSTTDDVLLGSSSSLTQPPNMNQQGKISFMTYNMLEQALSFGAIPWVMIIPQYLKDKCENFSAVQSLLTKEYQKNWHKNKKTGDYKKFRALFGERIPSISKEGDKDVKLVAGSFLTSYDLPAVKYIDENVVEVNGQVCTTLYGVLLKHLIAKNVANNEERPMISTNNSVNTPQSIESVRLSNEIFSYLVKANEEVFSWKVRGPRIFNLITNGAAALKEKNTLPSSSQMISTKADHSGGADYGDSNGVENTLRSPELSLLLDRFYGVSPISTQDEAAIPTSHLSTICNLPLSNAPKDFVLPPGIGPDVIVLQEYDAHEISETCPALDYGVEPSPPSSDEKHPSASDGDANIETDNKCSFSEAMCRAGYHSLLFDGPKRDGTGIGMFVKASKFSIPSPVPSSLNSEEESMDSKQPSSRIETSSGVMKGVISVDEWQPGMPYGSFDFKEACHFCPPPSSTSSLVSSLVERQLVPVGDRKHFGALVLELIDQQESGKIDQKLKNQSSASDIESDNITERSCQRLVILGTHLMTTSRDKKGKVQYPGEIRAHELSTLKKFAKEFVTSSEDAVILAGDFNINMRLDPAFPFNERFVFQGAIPEQSNDENDVSSDKVLHFDTGYTTTTTTITSTGTALNSGSVSLLNHDKSKEKDASEKSMFYWHRKDNSPLQLLDAYEGLNTCSHQPNHDEDKTISSGASRNTSLTQTALGSSHNAARIDTIDYIWYDASHLRLKSRSSLATTMPDGTPDQANPSDHIPLLASFDIL